MEWLSGVERLRGSRQAGVLVTLAAVRGHAPREAGAKMVVAAERTWGTIGGGNLEAVAVGRARELVETLTNGAAAEPELLTVALSDKAPLPARRAVLRRRGHVLLEPLPVVPAVAIFGIGHVGLELARILARHDLELHLVDSRTEQTAPERLAVLADAVARVHVHHVPVLPELVLAELPAGTHVLIMTHDHAEDAALCDAALRTPQLGSIGLIGSAGKWARFRRKLADLGHPDRRDRPDHHAHRPARHHRQGPGHDRGERRRRPRPPVRARTGRAPDRPGAGPMTLFRGTVLDTPDNPFTGGALRAEADAGLLVRDGAIVERGGYARAARPPSRGGRRRPARAASCCPGSSTPTCTSPRSARSADWGCRCWTGSNGAPSPRRHGWPTADYAESVAGEFVSGLVQAGTTTALVFGAHFAPAVDALFTAGGPGRPADHQRPRRQRPRSCREDLWTTPDRAYDEGRALGRTLARGRPQPLCGHPAVLAVLHGGLLGSCAALLERRPGEPGSPPTSTRTSREIATVARLFDGSTTSTTYDRHGLVGPRSVLAHNVHPDRRRAEGARRPGRQRRALPDQQLAPSAAGCSRSSATSRHGVRVALGSDVGAGTGFSLFKEGLQAYFMQQLLGDQGCALDAAHLLHLATAAGADALGLNEVGDLSVGKRFDAVWLRPRPATTLDVALRNATVAEDALAKAFALATPADVQRVWIDGQVVSADVPDDSGVSRPAR